MPSCPQTIYTQQINSFDTIFEGDKTMAKKLLGVVGCMLLLGILMPMTSATVGAVSFEKNPSGPSPLSGFTGRALFIGKHTVLSHLKLFSKNVVGWVIANGHIHRYRGSLPLDQKNYHGFNGKEYVIVVFKVNPFQ
ncbi:MAG TPA: hypothetical protein VMT57_05705 [Candidatus Thermoplasmatota archaeon]|nr:hypothetical protein [Candidatus Thermoplasmatota archaeon]